MTFSVASIKWSFSWLVSCFLVFWLRRRRKKIKLNWRTIYINFRGPERKEKNIHFTWKKWFNNLCEKIDLINDSREKHFWQIIKKTVKKIVSKTWKLKKRRLYIIAEEKIHSSFNLEKNKKLSNNLIEEKQYSDILQAIL